MEKYSILAPATAPAQSKEAADTNPAPEVATAEAPRHDHLRAPETPEARRERIHWELDATLQLLAERAHYITNATGAAIALADGDAMLCRASVGETAPPVGARLQVDSGVSGEAVRTRTVIRCDEASNDPRVNRETCQALGIESILVMPLVREGQVIGIFELFSATSRAFSERDVVTLQRMEEMISTAMTQAEAAEVNTQPAAEASVAEEKVQLEALDTIPEAAASQPLPVVEKSSEVPAENAAVQASVPPVEGEKSEESLATMPPNTASGPAAVIHRCTVCGFPVSGGRALCLDCSRKVVSPPAASARADARLPAFLSEPEEQLTLAEAQTGSWLGKHKYLIATLSLAVMVIVALLWIR